MEQLKQELLQGVLGFQNGLYNADQFAHAVIKWAREARESLLEVISEEEGLASQTCWQLEQHANQVLRNSDAQAKNRLGVMTLSKARALLGQIMTPEVPGFETKDTADPDQQISEIIDSLEEEETQPTLKRYNIIKLHAVGGIGKVWLAYDKEMNREVAIKEIREEWSDHPEARRRFLKEAHVTGQLEHPNIVTVYDLVNCPEQDQMVYAMRFVHGQTLATAIKENYENQKILKNPLSIRQMLDAFINICNAIAYAHSRGVIHRDLKPSNIMLGQFGEVVVLDWGIAKILGQNSPNNNFVNPIQLDNDSQTQNAGPSGTPVYMAPEQAAGQEDLINARTDIYGLGTILFQILTGNPPVERLPAETTMQMIIERDTPRIRQLNPHAPRSLDAICAKAMAKRQEDRYGSATELALEIQRWLADEPIQAIRDPLYVRLMRWTKHHPAKTAMAASIGLMILLGAIFFGVLQDQYNQKLKQADFQKQARLDLAVEAIQAFHNDVAMDLRLKEPKLAPLRLKLLEIPANFYQRVLKESESSEEVLASHQKWIPDAQMELAIINYEIGSIEKAIQTAREAKQGYEQMVEKDPNNLQYQAKLADVLDLLGNFLRFTGELNQSEQIHFNALNIRQQLIKKGYPEISSLNGLGKTQAHLSNLYNEMQKMTEAKQFIRQSLDCYSKLSKMEPGKPSHQANLAINYYMLGNINKNMNSNRESEQAHNNALRIWQDLIKTDPKPTYRFYLAQCQNNLSIIYAGSNRIQEARETLHKQIENLEQLVREYPSVLQYQETLCMSYGNSCNYENVSSPNQAVEQTLEKMLKIQQKMVNENPKFARYHVNLFAGYLAYATYHQRINQLDKAKQFCLDAIETMKGLPSKENNPKNQVDLAKAYQNLGLLNKRMNQLTEAKKNWAQAKTILSQTIASHPNLSNSYKLLGNVNSLLAQLQLISKQWDSAVALYDETIKIHEQLVAKSPEPEHLFQLGKSMWLLADVLYQLDSNQEPKILDLTQKAENLLFPLVRQQPNDLKARDVLGNTYGLRIATLERLSLHQEASQYWTKNLVIAPPHLVTLFRVNRSLALARAKMHQEAVQEAREILKSAELDTHAQMELVHVFALAAEAAKNDQNLTPQNRGQMVESDVSEAMASLWRLEQQGYFKNPKNCSDLQKNPDLDEIRDHSDFEALLRSVMFPSDPFQKP